MTSLRPDQTSSTAATFTSTRPIGKTMSRIVSSVMSVGRLAAFFGQEIHAIPSGFSAPRMSGAAASSSAAAVKKA